MNDLHEFVRNGRTHYREAKQATTAFEDELLGRLRACVEQRTGWGPFDKGRVTTSLSRAAGEGFWIGLFVKGRIGKEDVELEIGFWWLTAQHQIDDKEVVFASFSAGPEGLRVFRPDEAGGLRSFVWDERTYLALPMPEDMEPATALGRLLDALMRQM